MAFNIIAETTRKLDYGKIHSKVYSEDSPFEIFPMPGLGVKGGDAIGICIPIHNATQASWEKLKPILRILKSKFGCDVYDLYGGQKLGLFNISTFKRHLLGG